MFTRIDYQFHLSTAEIDKISELAVQKMTEIGIPRRDITRLRLGIEELLLNFLQSSEGNEGVFSFYKKWGRFCLEVRIQGDNPEEKDNGEENGDEGSFSEYSWRILGNMGLEPETFHKKHWNYIRLKLQKKKKNPLINIGIAILLAVIVGLGSSWLFPQSKELVDGIVSPLLDTFVGLLSTLAGPMIFLSVVWGILCIGDAATLGKIGKKLVTRFVFTVLLITVFAFAASFFVFRLNFEYSNLDFTQFKNVYEIVLDIFPSNLIAPFYEGNIMQIIVIAIPVGVVTLILQQESRTVVDFVEQSNRIVQYIMELLTKLLPIFVFLSLTQTFLSDSVLKLGTCWKMFLLMLLVPLVFFAGMFFFTARKYHVKLAVLFRKILPTFLIAFTTASSSAAFSTNLECCEKKLGISKKLTRFGIPVGMVIYMPAFAVTLILMCVYMAEVYGVSISVGWIIIAILEAVLLSIAAPPIPGGALTCYAVIFAQLGIPDEAVAIAAILDIICDFYTTAMDLIFLQMELLWQADTLKMLDRDTLLKE